MADFAKKQLVTVMLRYRMIEPFKGITLKLEWDLRRKLHFFFIQKYYRVRFKYKQSAFRGFFPPNKQQNRKAKNNSVSKEDPAS